MTRPCARGLGIFIGRAGFWLRIASLVLMAQVSSPGTLRAGDELKDANEAIDRKDYNAAIELLHGFVGQNPKSAEAQFLLGLALKGARRSDEAIAAFEQALRIDKRYADAQFEIGMEQLKKGRLAEAEETFQKGLEKKLKPPGPFCYGLGLLKTATDSLRAATVWLIKATQADPTNAAYFKALGDVYAKQKVSELAVNEYTRALELDPNAADVYYAIGQMRFEERNWKEVLEAWEKAVSIDPDFTPVYGDLIGLYLIMKPPRYEQAVPLLRKAVELYPENKRYPVELARAMGKTQAFREEALPRLEKALELAPEDVEIQTLVGDLALAHKDYGRAIQAYERATELDPQFVGALKGLAEAQKASGDTSAAISTLRLVAERDTSMEGEGVEGALGLLLYKQGRYDEAIPNLKEKLRTSPEVPFLYSLLVKCYVEKKEFDAVLSEVKPALDSAVVNHPDAKRLREVYGDLGIELFKAKRFSEAIEMFRSRLVYDPENWSILLNLGYAYFQKEDYPKAIGSFSRVTDLKPDNAQAHFMKGVCYRYLDQGAKAKAAFVQAVKLDPENVEALKQAGLSLLLEAQTLQKEQQHKESQREAAEAATYFRKAATKRTKDAQAHVWLAQAYAMSKQLEQAKATFRKVLEMDPDNGDAKSGLERLEGASR